MKGHKRNRSLLQERAKQQLLVHQRSLSLPRHPTKQHSQPFQYQENLLSQSITLPLSTEFYRESYPKKKGSKQSSRHISKDKKLVKSKEKASLSRKKKEKMKKKEPQKSSGARHSFQRRGQIGETKDLSNKKNSRELNVKKKSGEKGPKALSGEKRGVKPGMGDIKRWGQNEMSKMGTQKKRGKILQEDETGLSYEEILEEYGHYLSSSQARQIKEYKWVYFLGKITQRKTSKLMQLQRTLPKARGNGIAPPQKREQISHFAQHIKERYHESLVSPPPELDEEFYKYQIGDHIAYRYQILSSINQGSFGEVVKVYDHKTHEELALKIVKKSQDFVQQTFIEISVLTRIKEKDKNSVSGMVKIKDFTIFRNHICIVFELLDGNLYDLLAAGNFNGLNEEVVRIFAVQILNSLVILKRQKIIHCDLKPENVMMKAWGKSGVKLIDFGTSCFQGQQIYQYLQSRYYRAPQVILRRPYSYAIDMWSFGCLMAELRIGEPIFAGSTNTEQLLYMVNSLGWPVGLEESESAQFLKSEEMKEIKGRRYLQQYHELVGKADQRAITQHPFFSKCKYIRNCMATIKQRIIDPKNNTAFLDFLYKILVWEPQKRLKPEQALQHPWIIEGLPAEIKQFYTVFSSQEYCKGRSKSRDSKDTSKAKSHPKNSKEKSRGKEIDYHRAKDSALNQNEIRMGRGGGRSRV